MESESQVIRPSLDWEITAHGHSAEVTEYAETPREASTFCARLFFANTLFETNIVTIRNLKAQAPPPSTLGFYYPGNSTPKGLWLMKTLEAGYVHCRWYDDADDVFAGLSMTLEAGKADMIQIWNHDHVTCEDDPIPGVPISPLPFA
jgi:hypothetical protein